MLNLTFLFEHVAKQKYNSYHYAQISVVLTPNSRGRWHQFGVRPACTFVLSDLGIYCWLLCVNWFIDTKCGLLCVVCLSPPAFRLHRWIAKLWMKRKQSASVFLAST